MALARGVRSARTLTLPEALVPKASLFACRPQDSRSVFATLVRCLRWGGSPMSIVFVDVVAAWLVGGMQGGTYHLGGGGVCGCEREGSKKKKKGPNKQQSGGCSLQLRKDLSVGEGGGEEGKIDVIKEKRFTGEKKKGPARLSAESSWKRGTQELSKGLCCPLPISAGVTTNVVPCMP